MKITLQLNGREKTFTELELTTILEKYFSSQTTKKEKTDLAETDMKFEICKVINEKLIERIFIVDPLSINQNLFKEIRKDDKQEEKRQLILEAFEQLNKDSKYVKSFKTIIPEKTWKIKKVKELQEFSTEIGHHNADWVEQALEWAQRIANGESWIDVCNNPDPCHRHRLVKWKDGYYRLIGGSNGLNQDRYSAAKVSFHTYSDEDFAFNAVPLVVSYD